MLDKVELKVRGVTEIGAFHNDKKFSRKTIMNMYVPNITSQYIK